MDRTKGIGEASRETGVTERMLRHWQSVGYINPEVVICGDRKYRRYNSRDIELIKNIAAFQSDGFTLKAAVKNAKLILEDEIEK